MTLHMTPSGSAICGGEFVDSGMRMCSFTTASSTDVGPPVGALIYQKLVCRECGAVSVGKCVGNVQPGGVWEYSGVST